MKPVSQIEDPRVAALASQAEQFLGALRWCRRIVESELAWASAGLFGVFRIRIDPAREDIDPVVWVITGDLPPAYLAYDPHDTWQAETAMGLLVQHARAAPAPPSARTALRIPADFEDLVLACLAKDPADRPQSARELSGRLAGLEGASAWSQDRAREWWVTHQPGAPVTGP